MGDVGLNRRANLLLGAYCCFACGNVATTPAGASDVDGGAPICPTGNAQPPYGPSEAYSAKTTAYLATRIGFANSTTADGKSVDWKQIGFDIDCRDSACKFGQVHDGIGSTDNAFGADLVPHVMAPADLDPDTVLNQAIGSGNWTIGVEISAGSGSAVDVKVYEYVWQAAPGHWVFDPSHVRKIAGHITQNTWVGIGLDELHVPVAPDFFGPEYIIRTPWLTLGNLDKAATHVLTVGGKVLVAELANAVVEAMAKGQQAQCSIQGLDLSSSADVSLDGTSNVPCNAVSLGMTATMIEASLAPATTPPTFHDPVCH